MSANAAPALPSADEQPSEAVAAFTRECGPRFASFLEGLPRDAKIGILCHSDGDGLPAGALVARALRAAGRDCFALTTGRFENPWSDSARERLRAGGAEALIVCDLGIRAESILPGVPVCFVDHHHYTDAPPDAVVLSGLTIEPCPTSGLIAWWCVRGMPGVAADWEWLAAISLLSDVGDKAPFPELTHAKKAQGATVLRDTTSLLNALRRSATGDAQIALDLLIRCGSPREIAKGAVPEAALFAAAKAEVKAALAEAKKVGPKIKGNVAIIRIHTPCQVHPLVAQIWRTRLPTGVVIGANTGYRPGWVHFSARSGKGVNLIEFLRAHEPAGAGENFAKGHAGASGGSLPVPVWNEFVAKLGYGEEMRVAE